MAWMDRLKKGLSKARLEFSSSLEGILKGGKKLTEDQLEEVEEILISGDVSVNLSIELTEALAQYSRSKLADNGLMKILSEQVLEKLAGCERRLSLRADNEPTIVTVAGVNGSGKTTTIAKIASRLRAKENNIPITLAAADTFRAAAIDQLEVWAKRIGVDLIRHEIGADPSAVVFDALDHVQHVGECC